MRIMFLCFIGMMSLGRVFSQDLLQPEPADQTVSQKTSSRQGKEIRIYPNPVNENQFKINLGKRYTGAIEIAIFSSTGTMVHQGRQTTTGDQVIPVVMPHKLPGGVYTLHVVMGDAVKKARLVASE